MAGTERTDEGLFEELRRITKLLAVIATREQTQKEKIETLSRIGFQPKEIADLLGTTPNAVRVALVGIRKEGKNKGSTKGKTRHDKS